jgi:CxxC motif-containing protein (DUF1111 family)
VKAPAIALVALTLVNAAAGTTSCPRAPQPGDPLPGLTAQELDRFASGRDVFQRKFTPETGLGPLFNADNCAECHEDPAVGGTGDEIETHIAVAGPDGSCDPLIGQGGPVFQNQVTPALHAALGIDAEPLPAGVTVKATRTIPDVFGFGLIDAVPDRELLKLADPYDRDHDGISGRAHLTADGHVGRFGRKAAAASLDDFNAGALLIEQGITSPGNPVEETIGGKPIPPGVDPVPEPEMSADDVQLLNDFVRFLAPPIHAPFEGQAQRGRLIFGTIGCASCHTPSLTTGPSKVRALSFKRFEPYSDLLLHDMGEERADICLGQATPSEFRTEPLMGLRLAKVFLHDGAATSIEQAIELHGGEATRAKQRFDRLKSAERAALLKFLGSL